MGSHANYYQIIEQLVFLKNEFYRLKNEKYQGLINELSRYKADPESDNEHLPSHKDLAMTLKFNQTRMNNIIKEFHSKLVRSFRNDPLIINQVVHKVHISIPYDERKRGEMQKDLDEYTWVNVILPVTPSLGDEIYIPFMEGTGRYERGFVHRIEHKISGQHQEVYIEVHPFNSYYYRWLKMKHQYEYYEQWKQMWKLKYGE